MKKYFFVFIVLFSISAFAQDHQHRYDSLKRIVVGMKDDTNKLKSILVLCKEVYYVNPDTSKKWTLRGLALAKQLNDKKGIAAFSCKMGALLLEQGEYENSLKYSLSAVKIYDGLHDEKNTAVTFINCGNVFYVQKNFEKAIYYHSQALAIFDSLKIKKGIADCSMNLGNDLIETGDTLKAIELYKRSLAIREEIKDQHGISQTLNNLGDIYGKLGEYSKSLDCFSKALSIKKENRDTFGMAFTFLAIGQLQLSQKNFDEAISNVQQALTMAIRSNNVKVKHEALETLSECYAGKGDFKNAYDYKCQWAKLNDSLFSSESNRNITEMQTKYATDKKERENTLLIQKNKIQALESGKKDAEINKQQTIIVSTVAGLILILVLAIYIFKSYRDKQKAHKIIVEQKREVEHQKSIVDEKQKEILDSIHYAKRIQGALLAGEGLLKKNLGEHFVFYKPKDIVSGDFYWAAEIPGNKFLLLTGDCTGHGVPGAFMSLLNISLLNEIVVEHKIEKPNDILDEVRRDIIRSLNAEDPQEKSKDGMDCSLISFDFAKSRMVMACANNPVWLVRNNQLIEFSPDKFPVGAHEGDTVNFRNQSADIFSGDVVYCFTDGFADQFGGPKGKKFKYKQMQELVLSIAALPMKKQHEMLEEKFAAWKGDLEQVDDVLVIGVRV